MVRNIAGLLIHIGRAKPSRASPPKCWLGATAVSRPPRRQPAACTCGGSTIRGFRPAGRFRYHARSRRLPGGPVGVAMSWFEKIVPVQDQDRAHATPAIGAGGPVDQVPGLRCGAVPGRDRAQPACVPQVQPPHAHACARAPAEVLRSGFHGGNRRQRAAGGSAQVQGQQALSGPAGGRPEEHRREGRAGGHGRSPARRTAHGRGASNSASSAGRWVRWWASAFIAP